MNLNIRNLSKSYGGRDILTDFSLEVQSGVRLCVCGPNGSGKSTLLRILAGKESAESGQVLLPRETRLGYVEQELDENRLDSVLLRFVLDVLPDWNDFWEAWERAVAAGDEAAIQRLSARQHELELQYGYNPEHRAKAVLSGLGFAGHKWRMPLRELSGGWRERAKLARVLTAGADILLLDEPTNHLDLEAVEWLESFLLEYQGVLVFVAHDRVFMDKVGTHLLYMAGNGKAVFRKGSFSKFLLLQEEMEGRRAREEARLQGEIERKMDFVRRFKAKASKARQAASRQKMAKKLEKELEGRRPEQKRRELEFKWPVPPQSERTVLSVADLTFSFPDGKRMWDELSFTIYRGQKIALAGPNGCGKSTLLRLLTGRLERTGGSAVMGQSVRLGYFAQHRLDTLNPAGTVLGEIRRLSDPRTTEEELMSVLGLFMLGQNFFERNVAALSGGEKSRLVLATLFLARCNFLILDEPTNHLDLESRESLVEALSAFSGTLLMVAHDRHLLNEAADQIWTLSARGFTVYENGFDEYAEARRKERLAENAREVALRRSEPSRVTGLSREDIKRRKREQAEARKALSREMKPLLEKHAKLEAELEAELARQSETEALLADPAVYADSARATELLKDFHALQAAAEKLLDRLAESEAALAPYEARRLALQDQDGDG
ncbi:MAG: ABC-F family ATP-binding cassette domain-containing protein [Desulfovibrio sp.]|jgi:ATP-binding cassette subfamily F protein 3|nr:ABC-F family ATP-binding cassette domain-containing protein [Desulfovibrio sp.]